MLIFRGAEEPLLVLEEVTCDLRCPFSNLPELFQSKVKCENLVWIGWVFQELSWEQTGKKNKNKNKITDVTENNTFGKILFWAVKITDTTENNTFEGKILFPGVKCAENVLNIVAA